MLGQAFAINESLDLGAMSSFKILGALRGHWMGRSRRDHAQQAQNIRLFLSGLASSFSRHTPVLAQHDDARLDCDEASILRLQNHISLRNSAGSHHLSELWSNLPSMVRKTKDMIIDSIGLKHSLGAKGIGAMHGQWNRPMEVFLFQFSAPTYVEVLTYMKRSFYTSMPPSRTL